MVVWKQTTGARTEFKMSHWLITGGRGFIGTNLIYFLQKNYPEIKIRILDNASPGSPLFTPYLRGRGEKEAEAPELIVGDVRDPKICLSSCEGIDTVIHLAANAGVPRSIEEPLFDLESNVLGTFHMLQAARKQNVKKFIFASSAAPLGNVELPIHEERTPHPISPYGASKLAGEAYCQVFYHSYQLSTIALRFGNVYGPYSNGKDSVVAKFIKEALNGEVLNIYGDGNQTRDFIYTEDLIEAIWLSANSKWGGEIFQISTNHETTVNALADLIAELLALKGIRATIVRTHERAGDIKNSYADISKAQKLLSYKVKHTLREGLQKTVDYFFEASMKSPLRPRDEL